MSKLISILLIRVGQPQSLQAASADASSFFEVERQSVVPHQHIELTLELAADDDYLGAIDESVDMGHDFS